jgi:flagellin
MQSASDGIGNTERTYIQKETDALVTELSRVAHATEFNGQALLNSSAVSLTFQIGIRNVSANDRISVSTADVTAGTLGISGLSLSSATSAQTALGNIDTAIELVSTARARFGAVGNRLTTAIGTIQTASENLAAANSRIRDVDVAEESSQLTRSQILMQVGVSVMAQANQAPQVALKLLS